ncbi:MAG TPA: hypothetical protein VGR37_18560 [Longimicrobiaceae bacterium]|nr:hypothetical protein [Longimicrobiaceae bacterium]
MRPRARFWITAALPVVVATACGDGSTDATPPDPVTRPPRVTVEFVYRASTSIDPVVAERTPSCVNGVGRTHIHPSWHQFARFDMSATGPDRWEISFSDVPANAEYRIRISDPNACAEDPNGASTRNVFANGVLLTRIVGTPGNGTEPGLAFRVAPDGQILP